MKLINYSVLIIIACLVGCASSSSQNKLPQLQCGDFLAIFNHKPKALAFQYCEVEHDRQAKPMTAHYRVTGDKASEVETYLVAHFDLPPLHFACCGWWSIDKVPRADGFRKTEGGYTDLKTQRYYSITMGSGETLVNDRLNWEDIPFFYVSVTTITAPEEI